MQSDSVELDTQRYNLDTESYNIFLLLQQNPMMKMADICVQLGYSTTLVKDRLLKMKKIGILRPDQETIVPFLGLRLQTEVEAVYEPAKLGLQRIHIILAGIPTKKALETLETFFSIHPYTHYQMGVYHKGASFYCQIDIPPQGIPTFRELLDILQGRELFTTYSVLEHMFASHSEFDLHAWLSLENKWEVYREHEFDSTSPANEIDLLWEDFVAQNIIKIPTSSSINMEFNFDEIDLKLLRELTVNGKINNTKITEYYDISRSRISRRINRLRDKVISKHKLYFDNSRFFAPYSQIIHGKFRKNSEFTYEQFYSFLETKSLPFASNVIMNKKEFIWTTTTPAQIAPSFSKFIWKHADDVTIYQADLFSSQQYYFYHNNYLGNKEWNTDKQYIIDIPLSNLEKII